MLPKHFSRVAAGVLLAASWAVGAFAGDKPSHAAEATSGHACTPEMAAKCTPEMAAACKAKGASAAASAKGAASCCMAGAAAMTTAASDAKKVTAVTVGGGYSCSGHGAHSTQNGVAHDCDACADMASSDEDVRSTGSITQVVKLKNGIMYVYTAAPGKARALQTALAQRNQRLTAINAGGDKVKLCGECKTMRGAMASGKLTREVVSIEGGSLTLMTSNDASMVKKLHDMAGTALAARIKT